MIPASFILDAMLHQEHWRGDQLEPGARIALYWPVAEAISSAARSRSEAAALVALGWHESRWASPVVSGHCSAMKAGERCDNLRARSPWQVHDWCRAAWSVPEDSLDALRESARCAVRRLRAMRERCVTRNHDELAGMFSGYRSGYCAGPPARRRAVTMRAVLANWRPS